MKSKFEKAKGEGTVFYYHKCNPQWPRARLWEESAYKYTLLCPVCGYKETHTDNGRGTYTVEIS